MTVGKASRGGLGARLEAAFLPGLHWGAEFLEDKVRLCALKEENGVVVLAESFEGGYEEAEAFARSRGLAFQGLHAAVSHLPFKLAPLALPSGASEEDILPQVELIKPQGLSLDALDQPTMVFGNRRLLLLAREDALQGFLDHLPSSLRESWSLTVSPLSLLPFVDPDAAPCWAALLPEEDFCHVLCFRDGELEIHGKLFTGLAQARQNPSAFARELKRALIYHFGSRFPGDALQALHLWKDGAEEEVAKALTDFPIALAAPSWESPSGAKATLASFPGNLRVAASAALLHMTGQEALAALHAPRSQAAESRSTWMRRAGMLAKAGFQVTLFATLAVLLLALGAVGFTWMVESKAKTWSGELQRWDAFQIQKAEVETQLKGMQGLLSRRTQAYVGLQSLSTALPPEVWLESWDIESPTAGILNHRLAGYALREPQVPELLVRLETQPSFQSVKLKSTEKVKGEVVEIKTGIAANRKDLVRFHVGFSQ